MYIEVTVKHLNTSLKLKFIPFKLGKNCIIMKTGKDRRVTFDYPTFTRHTHGPNAAHASRLLSWPTSLLGIEANSFQISQKPSMLLSHLRSFFKIFVCAYHTFARIKVLHLRTVFILHLRPYFHCSSFARC